MAFGFFKKSAAPAAFGKDNPYRDLTVKNIIRETSDSVSLVFEQPSEKITYRSGQFLTLILTIDGKEERRSYSFSSAPDVDSDLCVTVKRVNDGICSRAETPFGNARRRFGHHSHNVHYKKRADQRAAKPLHLNLLQPQCREHYF